MRAPPPGRATAPLEPGAARRMPDLCYGEVPGYRPLELDLYLPEADGPAPVIVYVHGGGWRRGSRRHPLPALGADFYARLAAQGFAVPAIDYPLSGEARFPAPLEDVRTAIAWVRNQAASYGMDAGRVFLWGDRPAARPRAADRPDRGQRARGGRLVPGDRPSGPGRRRRGGRRRS